MLISEPTVTNAFGSALRQHRQRAGHSQLELALRAGCTQKQLSFLETGRTRPRIGTVQRLCDALSLDDGEHKRLCWLAGLAVSTEDRHVPEELRSALTALLEHHQPWPALVLDGAWDVLQANPPATRLMDLLGVTPDNMAEALFRPGPFRSAIGNWREIAHPAWRRFAAELSPDLKRARLLGELERYLPPPDSDVPSPYLVRPWFRLGRHRVHVYSLQASFGPPGQPLPLGLSAELLVPADPESAAHLRAALHDDR